MLAIRAIATEYGIVEILISDQPEVLARARQEGQAVVGVIGTDHLLGADLAPYAVERIEDADRGFLKMVASRYLKKPLVIGETSRLLIREFMVSDQNQVPVLATDQPADQIFQQQDKLRAYIEYQYRVYGFGLWALVDKKSGKLVGKAGFYLSENLDGLEMGYHIFPDYQKRGLAKEACKKLLRYAAKELGYPCIYVQMKAANSASKALVRALGFEPMAEKYTQSEEGTDQYVWYCR